MLCALLLIIRLLVSNGIIDALANLFSIITLLLIAGMIFTHIRTRNRAKKFSVGAIAWVWERLTNDEDAAKFKQIYLERNAGDLIAPWIRSRSRSGDWLRKRSKRFIRNG